MYIIISIIALSRTVFISKEDRIGAMLLGIGDVAWKLGS